MIQQILLSLFNDLFGTEHKLNCYCATFEFSNNVLQDIPGGAKSKHVFQIILTLFIFSIKKVATQKQPVINAVLISYINYSITENYIGKMASFLPYTQSGASLQSSASHLSTCDFFLWVYLKSKVYVRKPRTVDDLKVSIRE